MSGASSGLLEAPTPAFPQGAERRLRVCLVGPSLDILGGQAIQLARLRERLGAIPTLEVDFLAVNPRLPGPIRLLQRVKYLRTVATSIAYIGSLLRRLRRYDVVHAFSASYWSFLLAPLPAMAVGRLMRCGVVLNYRSGEADDHLRRWRLTAVPGMRLAHEIVVPSGYLVAVFREHGLPASAISNFVEVERLPSRDRARPSPIFLSNRNFEPLYNVACTLRAFGRIQREVPHARLIVVGGGSQATQLSGLAAELGLRNVEFRGQLPPDQMGTVYDEADVYLNSPNIDNMPGSILEAFAAGLPVVSTEAGGIPYIVRHGENGLLVPCDDDAALAAAALRMLREPGLAARLSRAARAECLERYVWPVVQREWVRLYQDVARRAGRDLTGPSMAESR